MAKLTVSLSSNASELSGMMEELKELIEKIKAFELKVIVDEAN